MTREKVADNGFESEMLEEVKADSIDLDQVVYDRKGRPLSYMGEGDDRAPATLRDLILTAFDNPKINEDESSKRKAYKWGKRIFKADRYLRLSAEEKTDITQRVESVITVPLMVGQINTLVDANYLIDEKA